MSKHLPLHLDKATFRTLLERFGPSLALWRAAEIAALREQVYTHPILDVGCGDGLVTMFVLDRVEVGLDPDEQVLKRAATLGLYERLEATPAQETSLTDESIDTVISNSVLEHVPEIDMVLAAISRVLKPRGRLIFTTPTKTFSSWLFLPIPSYARWRNHALCHLNLWTPDEWQCHLQAVGLEVEMIRPYLQHRHVWLWDALELTQQVWIGKQRLFSLFWKRLPHTWLDWLASRLSQWDLSASNVGGGQLIVARKR